MIRLRKLVTINIMLITGLAVVVEASGEGCRIYRSTNISIPNAEWTAVAWNAEAWDDGGFHTGTEALISPISSGLYGTYLACCNVNYAANATGRRYVAIYKNDTVLNVDGRMAITTAGSTTPVSVCAIADLEFPDFITCQAFQDSGGALNILASPASSFSAAWLGPPLVGFPTPLPTSTPAPTATPQPTPTPISSVDGLPGLLDDCQDACWWQTLPITVTGVTTDNVMTWSGSVWEPATVSATGGISDVVEISGTVTVIISDTTRFTETLTSGHLMAISRTFSYGEASIAIGLFLLMSVFALVSIFWFVRR